MSAAQLEPWTNTLRLDATSGMTRHRYADRFSVVRVKTTGALADAVHKSSSVPAVLVSVFVRPVARAAFQLWVDGKAVPTGAIPALRANVIDLESEPAMWAASGIDYVHFHVRRSAVDDTASDLGYARLGGFRLTVGEEDLVLAQIARVIVPLLVAPSTPQPLALDSLELIVGAHLVQRYSVMRRGRAVDGSGLAAWQRRRATELLREHLDGRVRLADVARACDLSVSHFARSFKASFGVTCHRWLIDRRVERAKELLELPNVPLVDVASQCGFGDQAAFTRTFHRLSGVTPGRWRRERAP